MVNACKYSNFNLDIKFPVCLTGSVHNAKIPNWALFMTENIPNWMGSRPVPKWVKKKPLDAHWCIISTRGRTPTFH